MSDYQIFSDFVPLADAGSTLTLTPSQTLDDGTTNLLQLEGPSAVQLKVEGPQLQLTPADIAGVYPAPGSEESPDEFLPHIALERRTLPWERHGPGPGVTKPWLALMLLRESEMRDANARKYSPGSTLLSVTLSQVAARDPDGYNQLRNVVGLADATPLSVIYLKNSALATLCPVRADLKYLTHVRRDLKTGKDRAIVMSYRLPFAGQGTEPEIHTALLVSLEQRADLYAASRTSGPTAHKEAVFIVLHHWSFTPSQGGDFEQVIRSIAFRPNGGVLRFGNLPKETTGGQTAPLSGGFQGLLRTDGYFLEALPHIQPGSVTWRGPLRPFAPPPRNQGFAVRAAPEEFENPQPGDPLDYSHASAFELGRLLALARPEILEDLRAIHLSFPPIEQQVAINKLPPALQKPDWVSNPAWTEEPWSMVDINGQLQTMVKDENQFLGKGVGDIGGIAQQVGGWITEVVADLGSMGTPVAAPVSQIDIGTVTPEGLGNMFPEVQTAGMS
jgi:hypothetical protein